MDKQAVGIGDGQGSLMCCSPWGRKELDMNEWLNWTELLYNIGLIAAIHQHESAIGIHMSPLSWTSLPPPILSHLSRLLQSPSLTSLRYSKFPLAFYFIYSSVYTSLLLFPSVSPSPSSPPSCPQVCFLCLRHDCFSTNRFISTIFLDSIYMC